MAREVECIIVRQQPTMYDFPYHDMRQAGETLCPH